MTIQAIQDRIVRDIEDRRRRDITEMLADGVSEDDIEMFLDLHDRAMAALPAQLRDWFTELDRQGVVAPSASRGPAARR